MKNYFGLLFAALFGLASCTMTTEGEDPYVSGNYVQTYL